MPPTMPTLGRYWVGVWDLNTFPGVMSLAAGPSPKLDSEETGLFLVSMVLNLSPSARPAPPSPSEPELIQRI
jgi:hypothetical protein